MMKAIKSAKVYTLKHYDICYIELFSETSSELFFSDKVNNFLRALMI